MSFTVNMEGEMDGKCSMNEGNVNIHTDLFGAGSEREVNGK
jgi:hypothetical protein